MCSPTNAQGILTLIREVRPDQIKNLVKADKFFVRKFSEEFKETDFAWVVRIIELQLTYYQGEINIAVIFNWIRQAIIDKKKEDLRLSRIPRQDYFEQPKS